MSDLKEQAMRRSAEVLKRAQANANPDDWPEDFAHENGQYYNRCCECLYLFVGHKRRVICRLCAERVE